ncbi:MAG: YidC/Oxa1 family membrane protein insertase [Patescibacteria group bacterium]
MWNTFFYQPLVNALIFFYQFLGQNLGLAIIGLTVVIRGILTPLTLPSMKSAQKIKDLQPELNKLKEKYGSDKKVFAQKQLEFYKEKGVNPAAGCLPQIVQLIILIALYQVFNQVLQPDGNIIEKLNQVLYPPLQFSPDAVLNSRFLYLDLTKPDVFTIPAIKIATFTFDKLPGLFLIASAVAQFFSSKLMLPAAKASEAGAKLTPPVEDDMAVAMQKQMLYLFPIMTLFIGFTFPSGLVLYWFVFSLFMLIQQLLMNRKANPNA